MEKEVKKSRREFLKQTGTMAGALAFGAAASKYFSATPAFAAKSSAPIRIGVVLPYSKSYKVIGDRVTAGLELALNQAARGAGREEPLSGRRPLRPKIRNHQRRFGDETPNRTDQGAEAYR